MNHINLNILVVDDDKNFAHTLCEILRMGGYKCQEVHSVQEAQDILKREHFDCVLSDVKMPDRSGVDLYNQIRKEQPNLPFVLMTAYTSNQVIEEAINCGVLAALQKPLDIEGILKFFSKLSQSLQAAIISEEKETCKVIKKILKNEKFTFKIYHSIDLFLKSKTKEYSIVFVDAHEPCEHYCEDIKTLLDYLPERTIVIICDYRSTPEHENFLAKNLNLIVLPREDKAAVKIDDIMQKKFLHKAKDSI